MAMMPTKLLVLGAVRQAGPIHGYDLRRELLSWGAGVWANIAPGSIYNALKTLVREGSLEIVGTDRQGARPERTRYGLTPGGDAEFQRLLREHLRDSRLPNHPLLVGLAFVPMVPRDELAAAMRDRVGELEAEIARSRVELDHILGVNPGLGGIPHHVAESYRLNLALLRGELNWTHDIADRLTEGRLDHLWDASVAPE